MREDYVTESTALRPGCHSTLPLLLTPNFSCTVSPCEALLNGLAIHIRDELAEELLAVDPEIGRGFDGPTASVQVVDELPLHPRPHMCAFHAHNTGHTSPKHASRCMRPPRDATGAARSG